MFSQRRLKCGDKGPTVGSIMGLFLTVILLRTCQGLFTHDETKSWGCLEGWVGAVPKGMEEHFKKCDADTTVEPECRKHCFAKKLGLMLEGRIWLYKLDYILEELYPGPSGKESVEKLTDIILECSDAHYKEFGLLKLFSCSQEKKMWSCVIHAVKTFCHPEHRRRMQNEQGSYEGAKKHHDILVEDGKHFHPDPSGGGEEFRLPGRRQKVVLTDYEY